MEWNIFGKGNRRSTALRINHQLAESLFPPEVAKISSRETQFLHDGYSGYFRSFWGPSEEYMIRLCTRLRQPNDLHLRPRVESITDDNVESNCSMIENIPPKGVSFSDLICIFAMSY